MDQALAIANALGSDLVLLHVQDPATFKRNPDHVRSLQESGAATTNVKWVVLPGTPASVIGHYVDFISPRIVLFAIGRNYRWSLWKQSVTTSILKTSSKPVMLIAQRAVKPSNGFRRILLVSRLDGTDNALLDWAHWLAGGEEAQLIIVHVLPLPSEALLFWGVTHPMAPLSEEFAEERMCLLGLQSKASFRVIIATGDLEGCIAEAARETQADLVIVGRSQRWAPRVADPRGILRRTGVPVLSVPLPDVPSQGKSYVGSAELEDHSRRSTSRGDTRRA